MKIKMKAKMKRTGSEAVVPDASKDEFTDRLALESAGFSFSDDGPMVVGVSIEGRENTGKSTLAYSACSLGPTVIFAPDPGSRVVKYFRDKGRQIGIKKFTTTLPPGIDAASMQDVADALIPRVEEFRDNVATVLSAGAKVVILDTGTEMFDMVRQAITGKMNPGLSDDFGKSMGQVNATMHGICKQIVQGGAHLVMLHKVTNKAGFDQDPRYEMRGWKDALYYMDVVLRCWHDVLDPKTESVESGAKRRFLVEVVKNKDDKAREGERIPWKKATGFADLMADLIPGWASRAR